VIAAMPIHYTKSMLPVVTPELHDRLECSLNEFPELAHERITVGRTRSAAGIAEAGNMLIRLYVSRRRPVSYFTIGHELTHLLQSDGLKLVPSGEIQCDVWTLARSEVFLDDRPYYLGGRLWSDSNWPRHAHSVRQLCIQAIELRRTNRQYLAWLKARLLGFGL
jgi:hypothetical protein